MSQWFSIQISTVVSWNCCYQRSSEAEQRSHYCHTEWPQGLAKEWCIERSDGLLENTFQDFGTSYLWCNNSFHKMACQFSIEPSTHSQHVMHEYSWLPPRLCVAINPTSTKQVGINSLESTNVLFRPNVVLCLHSTQTCICCQCLLPASSYCRRSLRQRIQYMLPQVGPLSAFRVFSQCRKPENSSPDPVMFWLYWVDC